MPTTFNVIFLGNFASIDPTEGNTQSENAASLVGQVFGGPGDALVNDIQSLSPGSTGFGGGGSGFYDMNNAASNDTFRIDGGPDQTFDGTAVYNATITYLDGSTATITAVVFQDTAGNTYLAPEFSANTDQAVLEAGTIQSLSLDSLSGNNFSGMTGSRETFEFVPCFTAGVLIYTVTGPVPVEELRVGDLVQTRDNGYQPIRWLGRVTVPAKGALVPVRIRAKALGHGLPLRDLVVSPQHRMLLRSKIAERMVGKAEVLVAAKKLTGLPGIDFADDDAEVTYLHMLFDRHEIVFAEGAPTESLLIGSQAMQALGPEGRAEIALLFPEMVAADPVPARIIPPGRQARKLIERHFRNTKPLLQI